VRTIPNRGGQWMWVAAGLTGVVLRLSLWWFSIGSNDTVLWSFHPRRVLAYTYRNFQEFNHPPLMGLYASHAWSLAGGDLWQFARWMKVPGLADEALILWALWRFSGHPAFAVYALCPAAILVSGFHGSTDCLYAALVLIAAIAFDRQHYFLSGMLWSAALNVKLLPLVLIPLVFIGTPNGKALLRLASGFAIGLTPFLPPAVTAGGAMYRNMLTYNSFPDNWGIMTLLNSGSASPGPGGMLGPARAWWLIAGRYVIVLAIVALALVSRFRGRVFRGRVSVVEQSMVEQTALGAVLFLVLTPGFGVQYVMFAAPLLCFVDWPEGIWWGCMSGVFIGAVYWIFRVSLMPLQSIMTGRYPFPAAILGMLAWMVLVHFIWTRFRSAWGSSV
jgi:hypothetical protein